MSEASEKPNLRAVNGGGPQIGDDSGDIKKLMPETAPREGTEPPQETVSSEELDEDEREFRALRRDLPGVQGASAAGLVTISVGKIPGKNEFFRTHPDFRPTFAIVDHEIGMEKHYFAVSEEMVTALAGIGISVANHTLYLTISSKGALKVVPIRHADAEGNQNEYARTKEIGLLQGIEQWVRLYTDLENKSYKVFPAPVDRYADPIWPDIKPAKIFRLAFRDKGRLIGSTDHALFKKWAARDSD
jgi:hypothetical protein